MAGAILHPSRRGFLGGSRRAIRRRDSVARWLPVVVVIRYTIAGDFNGERSDGEGI